MLNNMDGAPIARRRPKFAVTVRVVIPVGIPVYLGVVSGTKWTARMIRGPKRVGNYVFAAICTTRYFHNCANS